MCIDMRIESTGMCIDVICIEIYIDMRIYIRIDTRIEMEFLSLAADEPCKVECISH